MDQQPTQIDGCPTPTHLKDGRGNRKVHPSIILAAVALALLLLICMVHLNGWSLDFTDRDMRLIVTDSMDGEPTDYEIPTIEKDSMVMVRLIDDDEKLTLKEGEVIQFRSHGILNHHRVISNDIENAYATTKGDNAQFSEKVSYKDIRGIVVGKDHLLGMIVAFVKTNWMVLIIAIVAILVISEIWSRYLRADREG